MAVVLAVAAVQVADQEAAQVDQEVAQVDQGSQVDQEATQEDQDSQVDQEVAQVDQDSQVDQEVARAHKAATPMMIAPEMLTYATTAAVSAPAPRTSTAMGEVSATPPPAGV